MKKIWILIHTIGCILEPPEIFFSKKEAYNKLEKLMESGELKDYDEIEVFEKHLSKKNL